MPPLFLCRPDRVGDVLIATSCLEPLRAQLPDTPLVFVAREGMRPLLEGHPLLAGFVGLPSVAESSSRRFRRDLSAQFARWHAAAIVHFHPDPACQDAARDARIPRRLGYRHSLRLNWTLTDRLPDPRRTGERHEAEYNFDLLAPLGVRPPPLDMLRPTVHLADSWAQSLRLRLATAGFDDFDPSGEPYAVLNPTAHSLDLRWPAENFAWLALELLRPGRFARVFVVGPSLDDPSARALRHRLGSGVGGLFDLTGQTNLAELGVLLRHAHVLVSRNTGTTHLAAAVGCPVVELFGRLEGIYGPARWRSLGDRVTTVLTPLTGRRWGERKRAFWRRSYAGISREAVLDATLKTLATRPRGSGISHTD